MVIAACGCRGKEKRKATLQAIAGVTALVGLGTLGGVALTLSQGGPAALMAAIAKSGFSAAFALIFVSEIGDKVLLFPLPQLRPATASRLSSSDF